MIRIFLIFLMIAALAVPVLGWWVAQRALPPLDGLIALRDLQEPVFVKFDSRAIPYIEAQSEPDLYIAQGYLTARDRLFQMDLMRRAAQGELSGVFGIGSLTTDKLSKTIGIYRAAQEEVNQLSPQLRSALEAYARGVNLYILDNFGNLPLQFTLLGYKPRAWDIADSLAIYKLHAFSLDESWKLDDLRQRVEDRVGKDIAALLFQETWPQTPTLSQRKIDSEIRRKMAELAESQFLKSRPQWGSNAWVISGAHSQSGGAILACDKHGPLNSPNTWYLCSLTAPSVHCAGATIPGVPGIMAGRNEYIAWGAAALKADVQDLFLEEFDPQDPKRYKTATGWQQVGELVEEIPIRFAKNFLHKVQVTSHGPVLLKTGNTGVSLSWSGLHGEQPAMQALWYLNRARSWDEFKNSLQYHIAPSEAFLFADRSNTFGVQCATKAPVRALKGQGTGIQAGWLPAGQWSTYITPKDLPSSASPSGGYIVAANQKLIRDSYPWLIGHQWCAPYRAFRIASVISTFIKNKHKVSLAEMNELQADQFAYLAPIVRQEVRQAVTQTELIDKNQLAAMDLLDHWDGQLSPDSPAATIYEAFLSTLMRRLAEPKLGPQMAQEFVERWPMWPVFVEYYLREKPALWLPPEERSYSAFIITTFAQALKDARLTLGDVDQRKWAWRSAHSATFRSLASKGVPWLDPILNIGPVGVGGDQDTVSAYNVAFGTGKSQFAADSGPTLRILIDMADPEKFYASIPLGESGHLFSPFRKDQFDHWLKADPLPVAFSPAQVERQMQSKLVLANR